MSDQPSLQSFFAEALHTQAHLAEVNRLEDSLIGIGDFLNEWDHSADSDSAVEAVRTSLRTVRVHLKFLLAIQLQEAMQNLQTYVNTNGRMPLLDLYFDNS